MTDHESHQFSIFVIDDDEVVRKSICATLGIVGFDVLPFSSPLTCLQEIDPSVPSCFVVDLMLPRMTGLTFIREVSAIHPNFAILLVSGHGNIDSAVQAMKLGAYDFLVKPFSPEQLLDAVNAMIGSVLQRNRELVEEESVHARLSALSDREREVLDCMAQGLVTKQIALKLDISPRTIDVHRSNISRKLEIDSPSQLAQILYIEQRRLLRHAGQARPSRLTS